VPFAHPIDELGKYWEALERGLIDVVATDHAPHTRVEKGSNTDNPWLAPPGYPGVETSLPIMIDAMLNGRSTLDFARQLREQNVPFVFATGYDDNAERFADFPGVPVVGKPYSGEELIEAIASVVGRGAPQVTLEPNT